MKISIPLLSASLSCAALLAISSTFMSASDTPSSDRVAVHTEPTTSVSGANARESKDHDRNAKPRATSPSSVVASTRDDAHFASDAFDGIVNASTISSMDAEAGDANELRRIVSQHTDADIRRMAVDELADAETPETRAALIDALDDPDHRVVLAAIEGLEMFDGPEAIPALDQIARAHGNEDIREAALDAIDFME